MDEVSKLLRMRNRVLGLAASSFLVWQGALLVEKLAEGMSAPGLMSVAKLAGLIGVVGWVITVLVLLAFGRRVMRAKAHTVINDELSQHNNALAVRVGFKALLIALAAFLGAEPFFDLDVELVIRSLIIVAVATPLATFVYLSSGEGGEAA